MKVSSVHASPESLNALLDQVYSDERRSAHAQAESAHVVEQGHLRERVNQLHQQADETRNAAIVSAVAGGVSALSTGIGAAFAANANTSQAADRIMAVSGGIGKLSESSASLINGVGFGLNAQRHGIQAESEQQLANDAGFASRAALERAGDLRQSRERVQNLSDRNEETRHSTNMLFRA